MKLPLHSRILFMRLNQSVQDWGLSQYLCAIVSHLEYQELQLNLMPKAK